MGTASEQTPSYYMESKSLEPRCVLQYTLEGYGLLSYEGATYTVNPGQAFVFSRRIPGVSYYYPPNGTEPWRFVFCEFFNFNDAVEQLTARHGPLFDFGTGSPVIQKLLALLARQQKREEMISGPESLRLCTDLIEEMDLIVESKDRKGSLAIKARDLIFRWRAFPFSLPELAGSLSVSPEHLCREFRRQLNTSPKHYHDQLRVKLIQERFMNSSLTIKEIAHEFGFDNTSNFIAFFKKHSGVTPGEFQKGRTR